MNKGLSYTSKVSSSQSFDITARVEIDPLHRGQPGFILVAALLETGEILVKNQDGAFVLFEPRETLVPFTTSKILGAVEQIDVLGNTSAAQLGINNIVVDFLVGYGVHAAPQELYFHREPINLIVTP